MEIRSEVHSNVLVLTLEGDLLGENSGAEIVGVVVEKTTDNVVNCAVDLSGIRYMNSSGIGVMITIMTKCKNKGGETVLVNPSDQIKKLLAITKLDAVFESVSSVEDAVERFN